MCALAVALFLFHKTLLKHGFEDTFSEDPFWCVFFDTRPKPVPSLVLFTEFLVVSSINIIHVPKNVLVNDCQHPVHALRSEVLDKSTVVLQESRTEFSPRRAILSLEVSVPKVLCVSDRQLRGCSWTPARCGDMEGTFCGDFTSQFLFCVWRIGAVRRVDLRRRRYLFQGVVLTVLFLRNTLLLGVFLGFLFLFLGFFFLVLCFNCWAQIIWKSRDSLNVNAGNAATTRCWKHLQETFTSATAGEESVKLIGKFTTRESGREGGREGGREIWR